MTLAEALDRLKAEGVRIVPEGARLRFVPRPSGEVAAALREHAEDLKRLVAQALVEDEYEVVAGEWGPERRKKSSGGRGAFAVC